MVTGVPWVGPRAHSGEECCGYVSWLGCSLCVHSCSHVGELNMQEGVSIPCDSWPAGSRTLRDTNLFPKHARMHSHVAAISAR